MTPGSDSSQPGHTPRGSRSFRFTLALSYLVLLAVLGAGGYVAGQRLLASEVDASGLRYEAEVNRRLQAELDTVTTEVSALALTLVALAQDGSVARPAQKAAIEALLRKLPATSVISAIGIWPEPTTTTAGTPRDSQLWLRDPTGLWQARGDYNAADTVPYWREPWYTPARLVRGGDCYWTARYRDVLTQRESLGCTRALIGTRGFEGVVTVTIDLDRFASLFARATQDDDGYALLTDRDGQLLALSQRARARVADLPGPPLGPGRNIAELAQRLPALNPLAVAMHARSEAFLADALHSPVYEARQITQLKDNTRDLSRSDADSMLAAVWNRAVQRPAAAPQILRQPEDPVLAQAASGILAWIPGPDWQLASLTPTGDGQGSLQRLLARVGLLGLAAMAATLLLALLLIELRLLGPLRRMLRELSRDGAGSDILPATLDESSRSEVGLLAHWFNERAARIRDLAERVQSLGGQLSLDSAERVRAQEALLRVQERSHLALTSVEDGVVTLDERGRIEDANPVAEKLLGITLRSLRGTAFMHSFPTAIDGTEGGEDAEPMPVHPVALALEQARRADYPDGLILRDAQGVDRAMSMSVAPLLVRNARVMGCVIVLRPLGARTQAGATAGDGIDAVTGLAGRAACERRLRRLLDRTKKSEQHALLVVETRGSARSDDAADGMPITDHLLQIAGGSESSFLLQVGRHAITLEGASATVALERAQQLTTRIARDAALSGLRMAIGIVVLSPEIESAVEALRRAAVAANAALQSGDGQVRVYDPDQDTATSTGDDQIWVDRIRRGFEQNRFHLTTQWIAPTRAHLGDGQVFEALVALEDEEGFWAPAGSFLPVAERHHLAAEIDRWVLVRVLESFSNSAALCGRTAFCGIGLSALSIGDPAFLDFVAAQLNAHPEVPASKLCFKMQDHALVANLQASRRFCEALRAMGCRTAISQRLGGLGSQGDLRDLTVDYLKLDGSSFAALADDPYEQTLAEATLRLAGLLERRVIVSHLDDEVNTTIWRRLGADYLQGYALAKPSPVAFAAPS